MEKSGDSTKLHLMKVHLIED